MIKNIELKTLIKLQLLVKQIVTLYFVIENEGIPAGTSFSGHGRLNSFDCLNTTQHFFFTLFSSCSFHTVDCVRIVATVLCTQGRDSLHTACEEQHETKEEQADDVKV